MATSPPIHVISTRVLEVRSHLFAGEKGWTLGIYPMIEITGLVERDTAHDMIRDIKEAGQNGCLLFTSANAVKQIKAACESFDIPFPAGIPALFVGKKTASLAEELLQTRLIEVANSSAALLQKIRIWTKAFSNCFFICGSRRGEFLPNGIRAAGMELNEFVVYETRLRPKLVQENYDAILFFSASAVDSFFSLNVLLEKSVAVAIGAVTAQRLQEKGVRRLLVSELPEEWEMMQELSRYFEENEGL